MRKVLDPGHTYELLVLDDHARRMGLRFVKRYDRDDPTRFPGNTFSYPGTTLQSVIRCLLERMRYLNNQIECKENALIIFFLRLCLWLLEFRAARRHGRTYFKSLDFAEFQPMCPKCGHTLCKHENKLEADH